MLSILYTGVDLSECEEPCLLTCTTDKLGIYSCFCEQGYELTDYTECTGELGVCVYVCVYIHMYACMCACVRACVHVCVHVTRKVTIAMHPMYIVL